VGAVPPDPGDVDVLDEAVGGHCCPTCTTGLPKWDTGRDACSCGGTAPPTEDGGVDGGDGSAPGAGGDASDGDAADATEADVADATDADGSADA
jgi:hypothetical protein